MLDPAHPKRPTPRAGRPRRPTADPYPPDARTRCLAPRRIARSRRLFGLATAGCLLSMGAPGPAAAGSSAEWLASMEGPSPTVTSKSGVGTAQASARAKVTSESLKSFCADSASQGDPAQAKAAVDACVKQQKPELGKTYTITADCTVGRLQPLDGKSYVLDGVWDNSDIGGGRTRWKGPDGAVVGRDNASGGLALSQQWEVLCPGRVSASVLSKARALGPAGGAAAATSQAPAPSVCGGDASCTEVNGFAMSVVEFRTSLQGAWKVVTTTLRFRNKLGRPLVLGYVVGSGGATDDRGNRYIVKDGDVRGIGLISHQPDAKFVISPGQTGDARFTLVWGGQGLFGNTFDLDLTVREIVPVGNGQNTLGPEFPLQIVGLVDGARAGAPTVAQAAGTAPAGPAPQAPADSQPPPTGTAPAQGGSASPFGAPAIPGVPGTATTAGGAHCAPGSSCQDAGPFSVTLAQSAAAVSGKNRVVRFSIRVKNQTAQPLALAYKAGTNAAVDELGNAYTWGRPGTHDGSAQGIGTIEGARIDPQFQLAPGASREAQLVLTAFDAGPKPAGRTYTLNTVLVELRGMPNGQQWQKVREYAIHLPGAGTAATPAVSQNPANDGIQKASDLLKGLLGGK